MKKFHVLILEDTTENRKKIEFLKEIGYFEMNKNPTEPPYGDTNRAARLMKWLINDAPKNPGHLLVVILLLITCILAVIEVLR